MDRCSAFLNILAMLLVIGILGMFLVGQIGLEHHPEFSLKKLYSSFSQAKKDLERHIKIPPVVPEFDFEMDEPAESPVKEREKVRSDTRNEDTKNGRLTERKNREEFKERKQVLGGHGSWKPKVVDKQPPPYSKKAQKAIERLNKFINS